MKYRTATQQHKCVVQSCGHGCRGGHTRQERIEKLIADIDHLIAMPPMRECRRCGALGYVFGDSHMPLPDDHVDKWKEGLCGTCIEDELQRRMAREGNIF